MTRRDRTQLGLLALAAIAALCLVVALAVTYGRSDPGKAWNGAGRDSCPAGTFPGVTCAEDWPCSAIPSKLDNGEC